MGASRAKVGLGILLDVGLILLGLWRVNSWDQLDGSGRAWAVAMIAMGTVFLAFRLLLRKTPVGDPDRGARELLDMTRKLYSGEHVFRQVAPAEFEGYDLEFYERGRSQLQALGFRYLADVEDVTAAEASPNMRAIIRVLVSGDGTVGVGLYHARVFSWWRIVQWFGAIPRNLRMYDVGTELSSGVHVCTSNTLGADATSPVEDIDRHQYPRQTPLDQLLHYHQNHVQAALQADPDAEPIRMRTLKDVLDSQNRAQLLKNAHRQAFGYIDSDEIAHTDGGRLTRSGRALAEAIERAKQDDTGR